MKKVTFLLLAVILLYACKKKKAEEIKPATVPCDSTITYTTKVKSIADNNCISCHFPGGTGNGDFTTYAGIKAKVDNGSLYTRVVVFRDMPQGSSLSEEDIHTIDCWIQAGGPQ